MPVTINVKLSDEAAADLDELIESIIGQIEVEPGVVAYIEAKPSVNSIADLTPKQKRSLWIRYMIVSEISRFKGRPAGREAQRAAVAAVRAKIPLEVEDA